ncbi:MAG: CFI-box-CTERM domain-containing protein [Eubacteriales bacterium]|nr:CFI-box-CTERM domain-containing protein [Eubacteriales bacterium]
MIAVEINDRSHLTDERRIRDQKVANICEEAGIPMIKLWTSYGVNPEYIKKRITETYASLPAKRVHHFAAEKDREKLAAQQSTVQQQPSESEQPAELQKSESLQQLKTQTAGRKGCYIATCVYGTYDCPQVWLLRRFRDTYLSRSRSGRMFIKLYYRISPSLVKWFGDKALFKAMGKRLLDVLTARLRRKGIKDTPYKD